ncbi:MAG TPA: anion transporter, partial [Spirochaetota bacterium]|nr:anion transporter [Spirochaetota bacterium]
ADWRTLVFFTAMFIVMQSVWESGFFQDLMQRTGLDLGSVEGLMGGGILISQLVSNVPFVALILPALGQAGAGTAQYLALAAGSTIAGNLLILGAASNIIVLQSAERHGAGFSFWEFARVGIPLTLLQAAVYWVWCSLVL